MMTDEQFARAFERGDIAPAAFDHRAHVRVAWVYLREGPSFDAAMVRMREGIQRFAAAANASKKYHETITVLWMRLLADAAARVRQPCELVELLEKCPELADKDLPLKYCFAGAIVQRRSADGLDRTRSTPQLRNSPTPNQFPSRNSQRRTSGELRPNTRFRF